MFTWFRIYISLINFSNDSHFIKKFFLSVPCLFIKYIPLDNTSAVFYLWPKMNELLRIIVAFSDCDAKQKEIICFLKRLMSHRDQSLSWGFRCKTGADPGQALTQRRARTLTETNSQSHFDWPITRRKATPLQVEHTNPTPKCPATNPGTELRIFSL